MCIPLTLSTSRQGKGFKEARHCMVRRLANNIDFVGNCIELIQLERAPILISILICGFTLSIDLNGGLALIARLCLCLQMQGCVCLCLSMRVCWLVCTCMCVHVCVCVCVRVCHVTQNLQFCEWSMFERTLSVISNWLKQTNTHTF